MDISANLQLLNISELNEMQIDVRDSYQKGRDFVLFSPTGSGKTLAFSLVIAKDLQPDLAKTQTLIIVPTRELALQIEEVVKKLLRPAKVTCLYGGNDTKVEKNKLKETPQILIGTPGRIIYHLQRNTIDLSTLNSLVLDEFDKSLELGFHDQMHEILNHTRYEFLTLTSATKLLEYPDFLHLNNPVEVDRISDNEFAPKLTLRKVTTPGQYKLSNLFRLICKLGSQKMLIFCNHREAVDHISALLNDRDIIHDVFHGGLDQYERELAIIKFRNETSQIIITTDLAARGLDIPDIDAIIHYQLPAKQDAFIHRNGRTARMRNEGTIYIMVKPDDQYAYLPAHIEEEELSDDYSVPPSTTWTTLMINAGKKNKVSKIDIVGFILNLKGIEKDDLGKIDIKERQSFVAVKRTVATDIIQSGSNQKIKGTKIRVYRS